MEISPIHLSAPLAPCKELAIYNQEKSRNIEQLTDHVIGPQLEDPIEPIAKLVHFFTKDYYKSSKLAEKIESTEISKRKVAYELKHYRTSEDEQKKVLTVFDNHITALKGLKTTWDLGLSAKLSFLFLGALSLVDLTIASSYSSSIPFALTYKAALSAIGAACGLRYYKLTHAEVPSIKERLLENNHIILKLQQNHLTKL